VIRGQRRRYLLIVRRNFLPMSANRLHTTESASACLAAALSLIMFRIRLALTQIKTMTTNWGENNFAIREEAHMNISTPLMCVFLPAAIFLAMQSPGNAQDTLPDMKASLQGCFNDALTAGNFDKARMGTRGTLVVHCSEQMARQLYLNLARRIPERSITLPNGDKATERKFGLSSCTAVREKTDGTRAAEFSCRIAVSVGSEVLELF
jgi:hypothetical protein